MDENEIPEGWSGAVLGDLVRVRRDRVDPQARPELPYIGLEDVDPHSLGQPRTGQAGDMRSASVHFLPGDVLYGRLRPYLNKVVSPDFEGLCSAEFIPLLPAPGILARFLKLRMNCEDFVAFASHLNEGDRPRVDFGQIAGFSVAVPPTIEQRRIVEKFDAVLSRVNASRYRLARVLGILKSFRQALLAAACSGRLTLDWRRGHPDVETANELLKRIAAAGGRGRRSVARAAEEDLDLPDLPESWTWCRVGEVADVRLGGTPSRKEPGFWDGDVPWVSSGEVANCRISATREQITESGLRHSNAKVYPRGSVLIAMIGEGKTRGQSAILDIAACTNQNVAGLVFEHPLIDPEYVWRWALAEYEHNRSGGRGGNQPALNAGKVRDFLLPLPPLDEQREIVRRLDAVLGIVDSIESRVASASARADRLNQAALAKAFRGELVPTEAELARSEGRSYESAGELLERIRMGGCDERPPVTRRRPQGHRHRGA